MPQIFRKVLHLKWVALFVEEHGAILAICAKLDVAPMVLTHSNAMNALPVLAPDAERRTLPRCRRTMQKRRKTGPLQSRRRPREPAQLHKCRINIERLHQPRRGLPIARGPRIMNDQRNSCSHLEQRSSLGPLPFFPKLVAMIGDKDNDRIVTKPKHIKLMNHTA